MVSALINIFKFKFNTFFTNSYFDILNRAKVIKSSQLFHIFKEFSAMIFKISTEKTTHKLQNISNFSFFII